jgi:hypothetical protein
MTRSARPNTVLPRLAALAVLALAAAYGACAAPPDDPPPVPIPTPPARDFAVATAYPTLNELYQGAQGIYRGCGPNGNVCHNSRQYPNMNTVGAIALNINRPCNELQDDPARMDDWCERQGDTVRIGDTRLLLGYIQRISEPTETQGSRWAIVVQGAFPPLTASTDLAIVRPRAGLDDRVLLGFDANRLEPDPMRPNAVFVQLRTSDDTEERELSRAGLPADHEAIQFGDPNRNGVYGVGLGNALIFAGHPERSYIIRRLTDPTAGPLMPLANCCFWSKASLRALWCWIASLRPDGSNAMDPIDYRVCPDGPAENVTYPDPGPQCENVGLCPVRARDPIPDDPTWANVYGNIMVQRCGGDGCHRSSSPAGGLDLGTSDVAYDQLLHASPPRVIAGDTSMSLLYARITQDCPNVATCRRMPLAQAPLPANELSVIQRWIENGARQDGMLSDVMPTDGAADASDMGTDMGAPDTGAPDVGMPDSGAPDMGAPDMGAPDTGAPDMGAPDMGASDTGVVDMDAGADATPE